MKKNVLLRTNIVLCIVIILGFSLTSLISYHSNKGIFKRDIEQTSTLISNRIYHQIDSVFTEPINISLTMANDSLLKTLLAEEETRGEEKEFIQTMSDCLYAYKEKYGYDSVFLVSAQTNKYYHLDNGVDRIVIKDNSENQWYYSCLEDPKEYNLNIDNNEFNIFINSKVFSPAGEVMGIVGVGLDVDIVQTIFQNYEESFQLRAYLVNAKGMIEISKNETGYTKTDLFQLCSFSQYKKDILDNQKDMQSFWYSWEGKKGFLVSGYIPKLDWYLIIDNDMTALESQLNRQLFIGIVAIIIVMGMVLFVITRIMNKYNAKIISLTVEKEKARRTVFQIETEKLYENIYEIDITHNQAASEATESYFESLGVPTKLPYDKALHMIAEQQIKKEYREGYMKIFSPENIMKAYQEGQESLCYDFMVTNDGGYTYYWMRITARIFFWDEDKSVKMLIYRQNIDAEKQQELLMTEKLQRDLLSGLYNKVATQELISGLLQKKSDQPYAFFVLDIDNFKNVNDTWGHAFGDRVIEDFSYKIKHQFRDGDIVGRIGGDEFVVFVPIPSKEWVEMKAKTLSQVLNYDFSDGQKQCIVSASIGIAIAPESGVNFETLYQNADMALYQTKKNGKCGYTVYKEI